MADINELVDPIMFTLDGNEQTLPTGIRAIKPISCKITSLKKNKVGIHVDATNYADTYKAITITGTGDNYTPIVCGGTGRFYEKITGTAGGTLYLYK